MAELKRSLLDSLSGKIGNVIIKSRNGRTYVSLRPVSYKIPSDNYYRQRTEYFRISTAFCSALNKIRVLHYLWENDPSLSGSAYNKMSSVNLRKLRGGADFGELMLAPGTGSFTAAVDSFLLAPERLTVNVRPFEFNKAREIRASMQGILFLSSPAEQYDKEFLFFPLIGNDTVNLDGQPPEFEFTFSSEMKLMTEGYGSKRVLLNIITLDRQNEPVRISENICLSP